MTQAQYPNVQLFIDGVWGAAQSGETLPIRNPADGQVIGQLARAGRADLDRALEAADKGFKVWRSTPAFERYKIMRKAAELLRTRVDAIATLMTMEQGKPLAESRMEVSAAADTIDWFAEEGRRAYGRIVPARAEGVQQHVLKEPVGPVAAFTPWNFPINQLVRKVSAALAAGCSVIAKAAEETPASPAELVRTFADAGVPAGVLNLVYGNPAEISEYLVPHPVIRKISFTGSTPVGKQLAALAGLHMKRATMELGGHAPVIVFEDADLDNAARVLAGSKFRNAGQVCVSPTRFLVHESVLEAFREKFVAAIGKIKVGNGLADGTTMGPLANPRRLAAMEAGVADALQQGARLSAGGKRIGDSGNFFEPTVLTHLPAGAKFMSDEPFGPVALLNPFSSFDEVVREANRLPYGLASYVFTRSAKTADAIGRALEVGMMTINHLGLALPEVPFGGVRDSGYGSEGGTEAMEAYFNTKFISHLVQ
ncbi:NAD-dependent succinate-semialdehyde dehydrogenase [Pigmentiphaga soli]|uniref:NAD-dependent succinate-semialdehyde dehydrogenase n=1 Tax=Pigmentiphaga soli TaxID=1007095 RepID=A0ABP8HBX7_9BURK